MEKYTDQTFFYKQTPVNYDGIAKFTSIKGNTLKWNQLASISLPSTTASGGITFTNNGDGSFTLNGTATGTVDFRISTTNGTDNLYNYPTAKYLLICDGLSSNVQFIIMSYPDYVRMATFTSSPSLPSLPITGRDNCFLLIRISNGTTLNNVKLRPQLFNLTAIFGSGNEPSTLEEFTSIFGLPYYDFNQGTLIPFSGNGIKTTGKNQFKASTVEENKGLAWATGVTFNENGSWASDYIPVINSSYKFNKKITQILGYDGNKNYIGAWNGSGWQTSTVNVVFDSFSASGISYIRFALRLTTILPSEVQLEIGTESTDYEPYTETITDLPISKYFPTGMKRARNVYDELTENKAVTRVGRITLDGTQNYVEAYLGSSQCRVLYSVPDILPATLPTSQIDDSLVSNYLLPSSNEKTWDGKAGIHRRINGATQIMVSLGTASGITTIEGWNAYLSAHPLTIYYPLATETETDAEDIFYKFYADGTEQLLPVNGSTPTTSYLTADIEYYDATEGDSLYRRFWLINGDGERWDLTDKEFKSFLNNPTGLGFRKTIEITRYGEKANKNNEVYDFPQPSGELLFYDTYNSTRYDKYNKFIRFLMSQPITLYYMIPVSYISGIANIFTLDCDVTEVQKTESKADHILTSSIVFNGLGFYEGDEISVNGTTDTYTLTNEGDFPVGFEITVEGSLTKPYITLSQDGELYGEAKFVGTNAYNSLYLNSNDGEQNIILQQGGSVIPNPLSYQDLSISNGSIYVTFVKLAKGVSELSIGVESGSISNVNIKYSPKYRSV